MRVVLDPNVLISALLSPNGAPAKVLLAWTDGAFELVVSVLLISELRRALAYPKLRRHIPADDSETFVKWISGSALQVPDPAPGAASFHSRDPGDDYLLALAASAKAVLVTGDNDLLELSHDLPIHTPRGLLALVES